MSFHLLVNFYVLMLHIDYEANWQYMEFLHKAFEEEIMK
jgi:hypothetical protein